MSDNIRTKPLITKSGEACVCGSGGKWEDCCLPFLEERKLPVTALELMRSRFAAYVGKYYKYLEDTAVNSEKFRDIENNEGWTKDAEWISLDVDEASSEENIDSAIVAFTAKYYLGDEVKIHIERASFIRQRGLWLYDDALTTVGPYPKRRGIPKIGRNDPCHCGSGRKFKKCCGI